RIRIYLNARQWSLPSSPEAGKTALTVFRADDSWMRGNAFRGVFLCLVGSVCSTQRVCFSRRLFHGHPVFLSASEKERNSYVSKYLVYGGAVDGTRTLRQSHFHLGGHFRRAD